MNKDMNWKLRKAFTGNNTSDVQTINGYIAAGEDNDFAVEVSPVGKEYPAPLFIPRTNLITYSQDFGAWDVFRGSLTANATTSPEGVDNAYRYEEDAATGQHFVRNTISMTSGTTYTASAFVKADEITSVQLGSSNIGIWNARATFNLSNGSISSGSGIIENYGNGWYRCIITATCTAAATIGLEITTSTGAGSLGDGLYIYGAQIEAGNKATEYIPTNGAAVTRSWDSFSRVQNQLPGICNGIHTHTGAASGGGIAATTITGTGSGGKFKYEFDTLGKLTLIEAMTHENLLLQSNTFLTTWTRTAASVTSGESGYDGTNDAWLLSKSAAAGFIQQINTQSGVITQSIYVKANASTWCQIINGVGFRYYDLTNGDKGGGSDIDSSIEAVGNGWYRISIVTNGCSYFRLYPAEADGDKSATSGSIYIQDAQLEEGSQATGYIETTTAPVREGAGQGYKVDDKLSITTNEGHDIEFRLVEGSNATTVTVGMEATKPSKPVPFPVTKMRVADSTDRQVLIMDQRSRYVFPKPTPYLLDTYEGAAAAYSLRRLRSAYTGPAVRVRRETNNDELDIYFNGDGSLDTATLEAFCAGTNGFVSVWYDQGQGGNDAEQTTTSAQPKIVSSGSIIEEGGKPAIQTDGSDDTLALASTISFTDLTWFTVTKKNDTDANKSIIFYGGGASVYGGDDVDNNGNPYLQASIILIGNTLNNTSASGGEINQHLSYYNRNGTNASGGLNGEVNTEATVPTTAFDLTDLFRYSTSTYYYEGLVQELVLYDSSKKSNRTGIETNINDYYNIY